MSIFSEVQKKVSIEVFFESVGIELKQVGQGLRATRCPNPKCDMGVAGADKYKVSVRQVFWRCWSCGKAGDVAKAASLIWGMAQSDAAKKLIKNVRLLEASTAARTAMVNIGERQRAIELVVQTLFSQLGCSDGVRQSLRFRGIPDMVIDEAIGQGVLAGLPGTPAEAKAVLERHVGKLALIEAGLWAAGATYPAVAYKPVLLRYGSMGFECRRLSGQADQGQGQDSGSGTKLLRYGATMSPFVLAGREDDHVITKSAMDALSLRAMGRTGTLLGLPGESSWKQAGESGLPNAAWFGHFKGTCQVVFSGTKGGRAMANDLACTLVSSNLKLSVAEMPDGQDVNDLLQDYIL